MAPSRALLLTDVVDSTRLSEALGDDAMARLWAAHDRAARDLLRAWRGRELEKTDGLLALFDRPADAVGFALAYHAALASLEPPLAARAGIHVGPLTLRETPADDVAGGAKRVEVDGLVKPVTARVMATALGGQTLLTADAVQALAETAWRVQSHGHWQLKGLPIPLELFEIGADGAPFTPPQDDAKAYRVVRQREHWLPAREIPHSIPAERDAFVGRRAPLDELGRLLDSSARLVSVLGIGGTGKTRLVTRYAWTRLGEYPGGVWFCDLSQARTLDGVLFAVAQGLDVPLGPADPIVQLARAIAGRGKCLVILDNFEQVADHAEATLGHWLDHAPQAQFVVTTRVVLGIVGEVTWALDPLSPDDAVALFLRRAEAAARGFAPSADERAAIEQLVKVLDGLPLAIELSAARVRVMRPRALLERMNDRFSVLLSRAGRRDRQATLRAAFDWSWELLSGPEQIALAQISVFEGGLRLESAQAVLDLSAHGEDAPAVVDVVNWLVDKSLVRQLANDRFDLLESVRVYAAEHLATPGRFENSGPSELRRMQERHGAHFAALGPKRACDDSCVELDNVVAACRRAVERRDVTTATRALVSAWGPINRSGPFRLGVELAEGVLALASLGPRDRIEAELVHGVALSCAGRATDALRELERAAASARDVGESILEARALQNLAPLQADAGDPAEAAASYERARTTFAREGQREYECAVLNGLGELAETLGRADEAQAHYEAGLRIAREIGDRRWEGGSAGNLAQCHATQGRLAEARPLYAQAVAIAQELGDRQWEANARCNLGLLHYTEGRMPDARRELAASLATARAMGHSRLLSIVQCNLGLVLEADGEPDEARGCHEAAVALARELGDHRGEGQFLGYLGALHARQGRYALAHDCLTAGDALLRATSDRVSLGILLCARAETAHLEGDAPGFDRVRAELDGLARDLPELEPDSEFAQALRRVRAWGTVLAGTARDLSS